MYINESVNINKKHTWIMDKSCKMITIILYYYRQTDRQTDRATDWQTQKDRPTLGINVSSRIHSNTCIELIVFKCGKITV